MLQGWLDILVAAVPAVLGIFWGAPLVARELEAGHVPPGVDPERHPRPVADRQARASAPSRIMAVAGLLSLMVTWWSSPFDKVNANRFDASVFDQRGVVAVGYAAFAFVLGVTAGVLIRRTLPAMAVTLVTFIAVRLAFTEWIRPDFAAPAHRIVALDPTRMGFGSSNGGPMTLFPEPPNLPNAWIYSTHIVDGSGHALSPSALQRSLPDPWPVLRPSATRGVRAQRVVPWRPTQVQDALHQCVTKLSATYHEVVTYQPAGRYWTFQWYELAIYLAAALALAGLCLWWVRRRLS